MKKTRFTDEPMVRILREADTTPVAAVAKPRRKQSYLTDTPYPTSSDYGIGLFISALLN